MKSVHPLPRLLMLLAAVASFYDGAVEGNANYRDAFEYQFVMPEAPPPPPPAQPTPWQHFYPDNYDFTDYSRHVTRSDPTSRNSEAQLVPSGPYFAQELKNIYHKRPVDPEPERKVYQTSWNLIDSEGNEYATPYNRPGLTGHRPPAQIPFLPDHPIVLDAWQQTIYHQQHQQHQHDERPIRKPISKKPVRKKHKVRPIHPAGYQQHASKVPNKHPNSIDKISEGLAAQSIASAYPNGVMGTLSLMAGLVWYLVNKSATPVVKMRQYSDSNTSDEEDTNSAQNGISQLAEYWLGSLKEADCQQRAICELVSQSSWLSSATRWSQAAYQSTMVQKAIESLKEEEDSSFNLDDDHSKLALFVRAASHGERGVDCAAFYPHCPLPFREESRDRRR